MIGTSHAPGLTLATKITIVRIMGVPIFVLLLIYYVMGLSRGEPQEGYRVAALCLFVLVAGTDALDGYVARSRNQVTNLGRVLDPLADKTLLLSALIILARPSLQALDPHIPIWLTTLVISRDVALVGGYFLIHHFAGSVRVRPRWSGKIATVLQMALVVWALLQVPHPHFAWLAALAGLATGLSFVQYVVDGARQLGQVARSV